MVLGDYRCFFEVLGGSWHFLMDFWWFLVILGDSYGLFVVICCFWCFLGILGGSLRLLVVLDIPWWY